ncbi:MAG: LCP family protein [Ruminococcus sp.]|nr:LCP family protein [Ruminococcus sp.]
MRKHLTFNEKKFELKRILRAAAIIIAVAAVIAAALFVLKWWENSQQGGVVVPAPSKVDDSITVDGVKYNKKKNIETLLLMGLDKFDTEQVGDSYNNDLQSDFLMLFVIDHASSSYNALHINRDTMVDIDILGLADEKTGSVNKQLSLAHTYGNGGSSSSRNVVNSVSRLLNNIEIEHYLSVTMDAVPYINDKLGGVEVQVLDDFTGIDDTLVKGETITLSGNQALTYVRARQGMDDSTNSARMVRQRQYLESLFQKASFMANEDEALIAEVTEEMWEDTVSDYDIVEMQEVLTCISDYELDSFCSLEGENKKGERYMEFYPSAESVNNTILKLFYTSAQ